MGTIYNNEDIITNTHFLFGGRKFWVSKRKIFQVIGYKPEKYDNILCKNKVLDRWNKCLVIFGSE